MTKRYHLLILLLLAALLLAACPASSTPATPAASTEGATAAPATEVVSATTASAATKDLWADITARGVLRISTDPAYPPQSELVEGAQKPAGSKCTGDEHVAAEFKGFDIDAAVEIAKRLGVEPCFVTPDWTLITGGKWSGRWDISVGSMSITPERMKALYFSQPYYTTPAAFFVYKDNQSFTKIEELSGKKIGVCSGCTYESYLNGSLEIPGETIKVVVTDADVHGYDTDTSALQDLALGDGVRLDAVLTALPTGQGFIKSGKPLKQLGDPVYFEYLSAAFDRASSLDSASFRSKVNEAIQAMHSDGTLKKLSEQYYGTDLASAAATFDFANLKQ
ncbi:MAG: transporter substrate-binding domain-containing protein [Chloroflexi bacterium]|nr:transporter substrate-binding domain-containing protein [Chloroflexota bacterium]